MSIEQIHDPSRSGLGATDNEQLPERADQVRVASSLLVDLVEGFGDAVFADSVGMDGFTGDIAGSRSVG